jgi:flagellar biosynthesis activator protein FlaF
MNTQLQAYARTAQATLQGRELEAHVLLKSAARLQGIRDNWELRQGELAEALVTNRKIWTIFVTSMTDEECQLPTPLRANIVQLGMFVFNRSLSLTMDAKPERLTVLIDINHNIAAGLRGNGGESPVA